MKNELVAEFRIPENKVSVIPFGINNTVPNTSFRARGKATAWALAAAIKRCCFLGISRLTKGSNIWSPPSRTLEERSTVIVCLLSASRKAEDYWKRFRRRIARSGIGDRVIEKIEYVPDEETELYFKAADVLILPYTHVFQSGVLFLGYSFGLPAIAADVGTLEGRNH